MPRKRYSLRANHPEAEGGGSCCSVRVKRYNKPVKLWKSVNRRITAGVENMGGMDTTKVKKLKELEKENTRLKRLVADLSLGS